MPDLSSWIAKTREVIARATPGTLDTDPHRPRTGFELRAAGVHIADVMEVNSRLTRTVASANKERLVIGWNALPALLDAVEAAGCVAQANRRFLAAPITELVGPQATLEQRFAALDAALARLAQEGAK